MSRSKYNSDYRIKIIRENVQKVLENPRAYIATYINTPRRHAPGKNELF